VRTRSISAIGVVIVGIVPAIIGGPVFAVVLTILCLIGMNEFLNLARPLGQTPIRTGYLALPAFALAAALSDNAAAVAGITAAALFVPLSLAIFRSDLTGAMVDWALAAGGALYLGLPLYAAVTIRRHEGRIDANWLKDLANWGAIDWHAAPRGLAWLLTIIVITWLSDTGAYLLGRAFGNHPLIPTVSPKKTIEGLFGGLVCASITGALAVWLFGIDVSIWFGLAMGLVLAVIGVIGDLAESLLKRQAGVKDSGTLIPGHGGMLDRLDALLFTWTAGWFVMLLVERYS
jgi:phosphatidate cytidylyltransferase